MQELMRAIYDVVDEHGATKIAEGASFSSRTLLSQKANPDYDSHKMNVEELHRVMTFTGDTRPLKAWAELFGFDLVERAEPVRQPVQGAMNEVVAEFGDVARTVHDAMRDNVISGSECRSIQRQAEELIDAAKGLIASVKPRPIQEVAS